MNLELSALSLNFHKYFSCAKICWYLLYRGYRPTVFHRKYTQKMYKLFCFKVSKFRALNAFGNFYLLYGVCHWLSCKKTFIWKLTHINRLGSLYLMRLSTPAVRYDRAYDTPYVCKAPHRVRPWWRCLVTGTFLIYWFIFKYFWLYARSCIHIKL